MDGGISVLDRQVETISDLCASDALLTTGLPLENLTIALTDTLFISYHKGTSDFIVVTFAPAHPDYCISGNYFGKTPIERSDIAAIGIVSYLSDWYPKSLICNYIDQINRITKHYSRIILYGCSMGAYAAIKHSKVLNADIVVALSPFKSIHPDDAPYLGEYYKTFEFAAINNMAIRPADVAGKIYALYDPLSRLDLMAAEDLSRSIEGIDSVKIFYGGHGANSLLDKSSKFRSLMLASLSGDAPTVSRQANKLRKNSKHNTLAVLEKSYQRHPVLAYHAVVSARANRHYNQFLASAYYTNQLTYALIMRKQTELARSLLTVHNTYLILGRLSYCNPMKFGVISPIFTRQGTVLSFNIESKRFSQCCTMFGDGVNQMVSVEVTGGSARAYCVSSYGRMEIDLGALNVTIDLATDFVAFRQGQQYLRAAPNGGTAFDADSRGGWETFGLLALG